MRSRAGDSVSAIQATRDRSMRIRPLPPLALIPAPMRWPVAAWRWLRALALRVELWELEHYIRDCERCGIADSLNLRRFRAEAQALRVRIIDLEA